MALPVHPAAQSVDDLLPGARMQSGFVTQTKPERFYRPELDGLRFFAFLAVYIHHTATFGTHGTHRNLPDWLGNSLGSIGMTGAFGVDLFFALSAYLITELLLRERELRSEGYPALASLRDPRVAMRASSSPRLATRGSIDVRAFYLRRILRIWPLYFAFLLLARVLAYVVPGEKLTWGHVLGFALFSGNWAYMISPVNTVVGPLWTVSVEEQFYILWPLFVRRATARGMAFVAAGIVVVGLVLRFVLVEHGLDDWVQKNSFARIDGIAVGILLALALRWRPLVVPSRARPWMLLGALVALLGIGQSFNLITGAPIVACIVTGWPLVALACGVILLAVIGDRGPIGRLLTLRPIVYLGRISYGLYVLHQVGLLAASYYFPAHVSSAKDWLGHFVVGLPLTVGLAALSYRFLEQPFLRLKSRRFTFVRSGATVPSDAAEVEAYGQWPAATKS
jgi:peptidoglycan/LPS O-acetylase OafA/YrhL